MDTILEVKNLSLNIQKKQILDDVSFSLKRGSFTAICGKNGAGKSQLLRILKGLRKQSDGAIFINNEDVSKNRSKRLTQVGLVFQESDLQIVGETVEKDLRFGPENLGWSEDIINNKVDEMLNLFSLTSLKDRRPSTLSGGEKRRLAIASVLAMEPDILFLDEPFSALDYPSVISLIDTLIMLHEKGVTLAVVTHEVERFLAHTTNTLILKNGRLIYDGASESALAELKKAEVYVPNLPFKDLSWKM